MDIYPRRHKKHHRLLLVSTAMVLVIAALLSVTPLILKKVFIDWLTEHGAQHASIEDVDFNFFTAKLTITKAQFEAADTQPFTCGKLSINLDLLPLFSKRIFINSLLVANCNVEIRRPDDHSTVINGLRFPLADHENSQMSTSTGATPPEPWQFGLSRLNIKDVAILYDDSQIHSEYVINLLSISDIIQWQPDLTCTFTLRAKINTAPVSLQGSTQPFAQSRSLIGKLSVNDLDLKPFANYVNSEQIMFSNGLLSTELDITSSLNADNKYDINFDGFIDTHNFYTNVADNDISYEKLLWNGKLQLLVDKYDFSTAVFSENNIVLNKPTVLYKPKNLNAEFGSLLFEGQVSHDANQAQEKVVNIAGTMKANNLNVGDETNNITLAKITAVEIDNFTLASSGKYNFPEVSIRSALLIGRAPQTEEQSKQEYLLSFTRLAINESVFEAPNQLSIASVNFTDLNSLLILDKQGKLKYIDTLQNSFTGSQPPAPGEQATQPAEAGKTEQGNAARDSELVIKLGIVQTSGRSAFTLEDYSTVPVYRMNFHDLQMKLVSINNAAPDNKTKVSLNARIDPSATVDFSGETQLFSPRLDTSIKGKIRDLELHPLTSYILPVTGRKIKRGTLNANIELAVNNRVIDNKMDFTLKKLTLTRDDDQAAKQYDGQMPLPLETALDFMKDKKGTIKVSVPVTGNIDNPEFHYMPAVNKAIQKALQYSALSYLKYTLQPWGTLISIGELVSGKMSKIKFEPVEFTAGQVTLSVEQKQYLDKLATVLNEKSSMAVALCGTATAMDKTTMAPKPANAAADTPDEQARLLSLARQRAEAVRNYFIINKKIAGERLRDCSVTYKDDKNRKPVVEILF